MLFFFDKVLASLIHSFMCQFFFFWESQKVETSNHKLIKKKMFFENASS